MRTDTFKIGRRPVGDGLPVFIVGEVAQAHDGSLGMAHAFIDAIAASGADAVKFQTHIAAAESSIQEPFRVKFSTQDKTRYEYWKRMEFSREQWQGLHDHAVEKGLLFLSSPFSVEAIDLLEKIGMPAWKVASGEISNPLLLERIYRTRKPIILSTGLTTVRELDKIVEDIKARGFPLAILQCTTQYPVPPEKAGLNLIQEFHERYRVPIGLSDHSGNIYNSLAAVTLGASILEVHVALSRDAFGPDVPASLTPADLQQMVEGARFIQNALTHPVRKDTLTKDSVELRKVFGKSLVALHDLKKGTTLKRDDLTARKPGTGIAVSQIDSVVGRRLSKDVRAGQFLKRTDLK
jgi:N,N'-diacetyllegionaminate synthase